MRSLLLVPALLLATACGEKAAPEETVPEVTAPAALTAAALSGSWTGMTMATGTDSVVSNWTSTATSDTSGTITIEGIADPINYMTMMAADSAIFTSNPYLDPSRPDGMMVMFRSVGRLDADGRLVGTVQTMVVGTTDVVATGNWHATKAQM